MNDQNPTETVPTETKPRIRDRFQRSHTTEGETSKPKRTLREKAKNVAAVVGVVTVVGVVAATVAKKKSAKVEVTLPDLDVTTSDA